jgi:hypothetical protein
VRTTLSTATHAWLSVAPSEQVVTVRHWSSSARKELRAYRSSGNPKTRARYNATTEETGPEGSTAGMGTALSIVTWWLIGLSSVRPVVRLCRIPCTDTTAIAATPLHDCAPSQNVVHLSVSLYLLHYPHLGVSVDSISH